MATFYKPNPDFVRQEAAAARARDEKRRQGGGGGTGSGVKINWRDFSLGLNRWRMLPAWNASGKYGRLVARHSFLPPYTNSRGDVIKEQRCLVKTYPDHDPQHLRCPFCVAIRQIEKKFPSTCERQYAKTNQHVNALFRGDAEQDLLKTYVLRLPMGTWNWAITTQDQMGLDFTDIEGGIDIYTTKSGAELATNYTNTTNPYGSTPAVPKEVGAPGTDAYTRALDVIAAGIVDLDNIFRFPNDEKMAEIAAHAEVFLTTRLGVIQNQQGSSRPTAATRAGDASTQVGGPQGQQAASGATQQAATQGAATQGSPSTASGQQASPAAQEASAPATQQAATPKQMKGPESRTAITQPGKPPCFGGAAPHTEPELEGKVGHQDGVRKCLKCPFEMDCADICAANA